MFENQILLQKITYVAPSCMQVHLIIQTFFKGEGAPLPLTPHDGNLRAYCMAPMRQILATPLHCEFEGIHSNHTVTIGNQTSIKSRLTSSTM